MSDLTPARPDTGDALPNNPKTRLQDASPEQLELWLRTRFVPRDAIKRTRFDAIRPMVADATLAVAPPTGYKGLFNVAKPLADFVDFAVYECGIDLDVEKIFRPDVMERFIEQLPLSTGTKATYRARIRKVGPLVTKRAPWPPSPTEIGRRPVAVPLTTHELRKLRAIVPLQTRPARTRALHVAVGLGLGVGADGRSVPFVQREDITFKDRLWWVQLTKPARTVPCLPAYAHHLAWLAENTPSGEPVVSASGRIDSTLLRLGLDHDIDLTLARLRATYIVGLIDADVSFRALVQLTGIGTGGRLADFLRFAQPSTGAEASDAIKAVRK